MSCSVFSFMGNSELKRYETDGVYCILKSLHKDIQSSEILLCLAWRFILAGMVVVTNKNKEAEFEFSIKVILNYF